MNFNYETKGIDIDLGGIASMMNARTARDTAKAEEAALEAKRARDKQFSDAYAKFNALRSQGKNGMAAFREMVKIDATKAKTVYDMDTQLEQDAKQRVADMVYEAKVLADNGRIGDARNVIIQHKHLLDQYGSSSQFTSPLALAAQNADDLSMLKLLDSASNTAEAMGLIEPPDKEGLKSVGTFNDEKGQQYVMFQRPDGTFKREYTGDSRAAEIEQERGKSAAKKNNRLNQDQAQRTGDLKNAIDNASRVQSLSNKVITGLDKIIATGKWTDQGVAATIKDSVLGVFGEQDEASFTRMNATYARNIMALENRAPGAVSNFEFKQYLAGMPPPTSNPQLQKQYYKEMADAAKISQGMARVEGQFIEKSNAMFSTDRDFSIVVDGVNVDVKAGDTPEIVQDKWLRGVNEREGVKVAKELFGGGITIGGKKYTPEQLAKKAQERGISVQQLQQLIGDSY